MIIYRETAVEQNANCVSLYDMVYGDMLYNNYSKQKKAWVNLLGTVFLLLPVCLLIIETSYGYVKISWAIGESSGEAGGLPYLYLFKSLLLIMPVLLMLALRPWQPHLQYLLYKIDGHILQCSP